MLQTLELSFEQPFWNRGLMVYGVDEVGRGPLAGPVVAACVGFEEDKKIRGYEGKFIINDSKRLTRDQRREAAAVIRECASYIGIGVVEAPKIDEINILQATFLAMRGAAKDCTIDQEAVFLIDGNKTIPEFSHRQQTVIGGDAKVFSIAAASIIAKEYRDSLMEHLHEIYPQYNFAQHKGYGTKAHYEAIALHGLCGEHRRSFIR
jgi:ribonuclease HII